MVRPCDHDVLTAAAEALARADISPPKRFWRIYPKQSILIRAPLRPLCLSGSRGVVVGPGTRGLGVLLGGLAVDEVVRVGQRRLGHTAEGRAGGALGVLLVGGDVEGDEEDQVRGENSNSGEGSELLTSTPAHVGQPGEVAGGEVGPRGEVDESYGTVS